MNIGLNFLPTYGPSELSAATYYRECLELCEFADSAGFSHVKMVEHHLSEFGGYSPDPVSLLSAVSARTSRARLITGAVIPAFIHPLKLASSLSVLDNLSDGRLEAGFGRGFLPLEFQAFGVPMDESRGRMEESVTVIERLWTDDHVEWTGSFHSFGPLPRLLPLTKQRPHPPIRIAATISPDSFSWAGKRGYGLMVIPAVTDHQKLVDLLDLYRENLPPIASVVPSIHLSYQCYVADDSTEALDRAADHFEAYKVKQLAAYGSWRGVSSTDYVGYDKLEPAASQSSLQSLRDAGKVLVGSPKEVLELLHWIRELYPEAEPSLHLRFGTVTHEEAMRSASTISEKILPAVNSRG